METWKVCDFRMGLYNLSFKDNDVWDSLGEFDGYMRTIGVDYSSWFFNSGRDIVVTTERPLTDLEKYGLIENGVNWCNCVLP